MNDENGAPAKSEILWGEEEQGSGRSFRLQAETEPSGLCDDDAWGMVCPFAAPVRLPLPPSHTLPRNLLYQLKRKALSILFQPVESFGEQRARKPNTDSVGPHRVP